MAQSRTSDAQTSRWGAGLSRPGSDLRAVTPAFLGSTSLSGKGGRALQSQTTPHKLALAKAQPCQQYRQGQARSILVIPEEPKIGCEPAGKEMGFFKACSTNAWERKTSLPVWSLFLKRKKLYPKKVPTQQEGPCWGRTHTKTVTLLCGSCCLFLPQATVMQPMWRRKQELSFWLAATAAGGS